MDTQVLTDFLDSKNIEYKIDNNPSKQKVLKIRRAVERKRALMNLAVDAYRQVRSI